MNTTELAAFAQRVRAAGRFAFDTEFVGEGRYRTLLCLIACVVADAQGVDVLVLDPLDESVDLSSIASLLADPDVEVVVHAGRQDVALLRRIANTEVTRIFDTQIAAGFAGLSAQASYDSLLRALLDVHLAKTASFTRWDRRPLSGEQIAYAREDVLHLLDLADVLREQLAASGRLQWALEECLFLATVSDMREPERVFERLPRIGGASAAARAVALELVRWREARAEAQNRPVSTVCSDAALIEIAKRQPRTTDQLEQIRGVNPGSLRRSAEDILAAVARGAAAPPIPANGERREPTAALDGPQVAIAEALVRTRSLQAGLAYELIATRADLGDVVTGVRLGREPRDVRTLTGWRRELVGEELLALLRGELAVRIAPDGSLLVDTR